MKYFDTIYKIKQPAVQEVQETIPPPVLKPKRSNYFFLKASEILLAFWIVTVLAIVSNPWIDYWVKSVIKSKTPTQAVMGESDNIITTSNDAPTFYLKNEKVEIKAPIADGIEESALTQGIGHHPDSVWPDEKGNVVLAGHNTDLNADNPFAQVFRNLRDVNIGDEVQIFFNGKNYIYNIVKRETVNPSDISLFGKVDEWMLTFYTCDPPYTDWKRLVFQAKLNRIE